MRLAIFLLILSLTTVTQVSAQGAGQSVAVGTEAQTTSAPAQQPPAQQPPAQETESQKKEKRLPKSGVLAVSKQGGAGSKEVPMPWGGVDQQGEEVAPIGGSVYKFNSEEWEAKISNNSKTDRYSANISVQLYNELGSVVKTQSFSLSLAPGESAVRKVKGAASAKSGQLTLRSWKKQGS
jgi:hypothetical protein